MLKRILLVMMLILCLPVVASATWYVAASTSPSTGAGTISPAGNTPYPDTTLSANYTVTPAAGYVVSAVRLGGVAQTPVSPGVYKVNKLGGSQYLVAYFAAKTYSISLAVSPGGAITPAFSSPPVTTLPAGGSYSFNIIPNTGYQVTDVMVDYVSVGPLSSYTFSNLDGNHFLAATFGVVPRVTAVANPKDPQTTGLGQAYALALDGSLSTTNMGSLSYLWSVVSTSPAGLTGGAFDNAAAMKPLFYADKPGVYTVALTVSDGLGHSDTNTTNVTAITRQAYISLYCASCHSGRSGTLVARYDSSKHYSTTQTSTSCQFCHLPGQPDTSHYTVQHPIDVCKTCHPSAVSFKNAPGHLNKAGTNTCVTCHDAHSLQPVLFIGKQTPHFNNVSTGNYPASYVTSKATCANCHSATVDTQKAEENRKSWAGSKHAATRDAAFVSKDFKTLDGCVRCHTATGFVAYSSSKVTKAWGLASDKTKEVVACNACHSAEFALRPFKPFSSASAFVFKVDAVNQVTASYKNSDYGVSNVCLRCHAGTSSGELVKKAAAFAGFTAAGRLSNHFMVGGGTMDNNIGYEFDGTPRGRLIDFNKQNTWHSGIGSAASKIPTGTSGACVVCHMSVSGQSHSFAAVFKNQTGSLIALPAQAPVCAKCHPSTLGGGPEMTLELLKGYKNGYEASLAVLKAALIWRGFNPDGGAVASWGATATERSNNMGAFYNYNLLKKSDRGAYVHNSTYARRLIVYSIDWLDNGALDDSASVGVHAIPNLPQDTKTAAISYLGLDDNATANCVNCHQAYF